MTPAATLLLKYREAGLTVATAESCTGGMIAATITGEPGASAIFGHGFVTYSNRSKQDMLGVRPETLAAHGAVSAEVAREMAEGALARADADFAVAVTGIAGPGGGTEGKPAGRVCFAVAGKGRETRQETRDFGELGRRNVREASVDHALKMLIAALR